MWWWMSKCGLSWKFLLEWFNIALDLAAVLNGSSGETECLCYKMVQRLCGLIVYSSVWILYENCQLKFDIICNFFMFQISRNLTLDLVAYLQLWEHVLLPSYTFLADWFFQLKPVFLMCGHWLFASLPAFKDSYYCVEFVYQTCLL